MIHQCIFQMNLLRDHVTANSKLKLQVRNKGLTILLPSQAKYPKITGIDRQLNAFSTYSSVLLSSYLPGVDLFAYQQLISESASKFCSMAWYLYDMEFRRTPSQNLSINWGQGDVQLYLDTLTGIPKAILCKACSSSDHVSDSPFIPGLQTLKAPNVVTSASTSTKGFPAPTLPATTLTNATSLDALQPTQERTTLTPQALDPPSQRLAAQDIPPKAAIEYLSKLSPTTRIDLP